MLLQHTQGGRKLKKKFILISFFSGILNKTKQKNGWMNLFDYYYNNKNNNKKLLFLL
jgi:thioredoxin-related protein